MLVPGRETVRPPLTAPAYLVVLLAFAACGKRQSGPPEIAITDEPPADEISDCVRPGRLVRGEPDAPVLRLRLRDGGLLQLEADGEWKDTTLDAGSEALAAARDRNKIEYPEDGIPGSALFASVEAEPAVPWQHVQWLLTIAAEMKYYKLRLSDGARHVLAFVPPNAAIEWVRDSLPPYVVLQIDVIPRAGVNVPWNETEVLRPTRFAYRASAVCYRSRGPAGEAVERLETGSLRDAGPWIARARKAAEAIPRAQVRGRIRAGYTVPFAAVFDAMETCVSEGLPEVDLLMDISIPPRAVRSMPRLPYPRRNYNPPIEPPK